MTKPEEFVPQVYRFALRLTQDSHTAEDLTQETFLRAWTGRQHLREPRSLRVWLFRIAANLWQDQLRRRKSPIAQAAPLDHEPLGTTHAPDRALIHQEDLRRALAALDELPARQREVLYLSACEELRPLEIAEILGSTVEAVKANLSLARKKLREALPDVVKELSSELTK